MELLHVTVDTLTELLDHHMVFLKCTVAPKAARNSVSASNEGPNISDRRIASMTHATLRRLRTRAEANQKRVDNELLFVRVRPFELVTSVFLHVVVYMPLHCTIHFSPASNKCRAGPLFVLIVFMSFLGVKLLHASKQRVTMKAQ